MTDPADVLIVGGGPAGHATAIELARRASELDPALKIMFITGDLMDAETTSFLAESEEAGLPGLKGHRSVGGFRASVYNAFPREGCEALAAFMRDFEQRNT